MCALNAGIQLVWGAILAVSLQSRSIAFLGHARAVSAVALLAAGGALAGAAVQIVAGRFSDSTASRSGNRQSFYAAGVALALPAIAWLYFAPAFAQLALAFLTLQVGMNLVGGPYQAAIPDYVPLERRGAASSWMSAYQSGGNAAGLLAAALLHAPRDIVVTLVGGLAATYAVTAGYVRHLSSSSGIAGTAQRFAFTGTFGALLVSRGLINAGFYTLLYFLAFFVSECLGVRDDALQTQTGYIFLTFTLSAIAGAIASARPTDRYDKRLVVSVAVGILAAALAALASSSSLGATYAFAGIAGAGWGGFVTADWALASALLPGGRMATAMGVWNVATALPQVAAPLIAAPLIVRLNAHSAGLGPRGAVAVAVLECVAGALAIWRLPRAAPA